MLYSFFSKSCIVVVALCAGLVHLACNAADPPSTTQEEQLGTYSATQAQQRLAELAVRMEGYLPELPVDSTRIPRAVNEDGSLAGVKSRDWTSGFFPGTLWMLADASGSEALRESADVWTKFIIKEQFDDHTHDLGFKVYNSLGKAYTLGEQSAYKADIIQASTTLIDRFNEKVGTIRSWDWGTKHGWIHPTIVDNMMNLEMLFEAAKLSGDSTFYYIAVAHADRTLAEHFRSDYSSYHVVDYDTATGAVRSRVTHQGLADESAWARGQAWGLYGYTMAYQQTGKPAYLAQARKLADYFFQHPNTPADRIPYFDFDAEPGEQTPRDASAATVAASAALQLATLDPERRKRYLAWADAILSTLERPEYQTTFPPFLLDKSTGNYPKDSEINVPINYADYYYVEALMRRAALS